MRIFLEASEQRTEIVDLLQAPDGLRFIVETDNGKFTSVPANDCTPIIWPKPGSRGTYEVIMFALHTIKESL